MITYLLDTNICIYLIKKKPIEVFKRFQSLEIGAVGVSSITIAELQYGINKSSFPEKANNALQNFLIPLEILQFDYDATIPYGKIRAQLEKAGRTIGPLDMLIGAHALSLNAVLVTNNLKEFNRIEGLQTENWII
ncbi:PIN domain-containing protein [Mucilaginibacter sp.]|uniref:type II toxin-antitoxin system tRNA(fMet)-specific endonuclease VapC n=1 Tax=Mucilaginibacter sp. TaxID=1882438 RepID=UPI002613F09C|nr:PIN domain-containing protein [Mucilaginibacter sp.]MDB4921336.1 twitching motility protein PilT [Mucilaginibacter sp.]